MEITHVKKDRFLEVTDSILTETLGEDAALKVYQYMGSLCDTYPEEFSDRLDLLSKGLRDCLGKSAMLIEDKILSELYGIKV